MMGGIDLFLSRFQIFSGYVWSVSDRPPAASATHPTAQVQDDWFMERLVTISDGMTTED